MLTRMLRIAPRFRRTRFLVLAAIITILIVRFTHTRHWEQYSQTETFGFLTPQEEGGHKEFNPAKIPPPGPSNDKTKEKEKSELEKIRPPVTRTPGGAAPLTSPKPSEDPTLSIPHVALPDRKTPPPTKVYEGEDEGGEDIHPIGPPGRQEFPTFSAVPTIIHWEKQVEHFPVPTESLIRLPTGVPTLIPNIQHDFNDETPDAKINREKRQSKVKEEFKKAWAGYKKYAWLHDELSPVSGKFRDPFCGWAATLVDTLDTLWIMGLQEEFEEAARAVDLIDFTTSPRSDIPVFETTIRYLGGLLAAYDVSDGKYKNLLEKAVELGEILMGAFDTPNRMPVLYYRWKPTFASQPHRASQRSNTAELGSLSMEFTRLAQLTDDSRYYDAVARITNALSEWQDRGTKLDGVFPDNIDASGCNRSVPLSSHEPVSQGRGPSISPGKEMPEPEGYKPNAPKTVVEPRPKKKGMKGTSGPGTLEVQVMPGEPSKAQIIGWEDDSKKKSSKRDLEGTTITNRTESPLPTDPITGLPIDLSGAKGAIGASLDDWDCTPQGLESAATYGWDKFSMGGGQDSTYEYFPKQYLLLGGLEDKYRKMYIKTIDAVRKWMLYRPMIPGNRDVLFSGSVTTRGEPETDLKFNAEVEHLTCFIGGMIGMGSKVFGLEGDLELAKRLADGCVWAYEATPAGIMPEGATVMACESSEHCSWNETAYNEFLDPMGAERDHNLEEYLKVKAAREEELEAAKTLAANKVEADRANFEGGVGGHEGFAPERNLRKESLPRPPHTEEDHHWSLNKSEPISLQKRQSSPKDDLPKPVSHNFKDDVTIAKTSYQNDPARGGELKGVSDPPAVIKTPQEKLYQEKSKTTEAELQGLSAGRQSEQPLSAALQSPVPGEVLPDPLQPLSHKEFVEARIKQQALPPGFVTIRGRKYILRPEAIESVWYMYRITGESSWQDKGWKMFEAIIKATSAENGHSAIIDVTVNDTYQADEMESFWMAETLKYFYLLYSTPDTISLDEWVLNTEAHPFKRPSWRHYDSP